MNTQQLTSDVKLRFDHLNTKAQLKDKYQAKLLVACQGGLWKASPELLVFVDSAGSEELILIDAYENPVKVNRQKLLTLLRDTHNTVMIEWYTEFTELEKNR
jgi:hypothetical protein